jgi:transposase
MLTLPSSVQVFVASKPVDLRKSFDGLSGVVVGVLGKDPASGHLYVFFNKRGNQVRVLFWDGTGFVVVAKKLCQGRFRFIGAMVASSAVVEMDAAELSLIMEGIDLSEAARRKRLRMIRRAA